MTKEENKTKVSRIKTKKKIWFRINAPALFGQKELGESYLTAPETAVGRTLKINLKDLTGNTRDQNSYVVFKIAKPQNGILNTATIGYELTSAYVKRMVRKNTHRLDDYFTLTTTDKQQCVVKTLMITLKKVKSSVRLQLRKKLKEGLEEEAAKNNFDSFVENLVSGKMLAGIRKRLIKVYPVREAAIRVLALQPAKETAVKVEQ